MNQEAYKIKNNKEIMKNKPDIKIFVSHRIDMEAETIDNPLYVNVRCGAVYDKRENVDMLGDNTGDNISEKRNMYNELTVQYWAWKNVEADYYGLCDARKYFSLSEKENNSNNEVLYEEFLTQEIIKKYELGNNKLVDKLLDENDFVIMQPIDIRKVATPKGYAKDIKTYIKNNYNILIKKEHLDLLLKYIENNYSDIYPYAVKYLDGYHFIQYNNLIMKKDIFQEYNSFLFNILFYLDDYFREDNKYYSKIMMQFINFIGILLLGIYYQYLYDKNISCKNIKIIYFDHVEKQKDILPFSNHNNIAIAVRISDYYAPYFGVFLQSIIDNADSKNNYDIIVLEHTVTKENKDIISKMIQDKDNISVRYFNPEYYLNHVELSILLDSSSRESYYSLFIPFILNKYDKLLVIDCDLILQGDIAEIYNHNIDNYLAASTKEIVYMGTLNIDQSLYNYCNEILHMDNPYNYVNTGVLLLNINNIRREFSISHILKTVKSNKYMYQEQDIINLLFYGKIKFIDYKYNHYVNGDIDIDNALKNAPMRYRQLYKNINNYPFVIHFVANTKPWTNPYVPFAHKWWEIARKTPFYEMILYRMTHEQSNHISFTKLDHFSRIMFPFKWLKKVHKIGYIRQIADKLLPHGTKRRKIIKKLIYG